MKTIKVLCACIPLVLCSSPAFLFAHELEPQDYIVLQSGDTLYGTVEYIDETGAGMEFHKKIILTADGRKRKKFKRKSVSAFRVDNSTYESFWLNQSSQKVILLNPKYDIDVKNGEQYFLKVMSKGKLSHFELEWFDQGDAALWSMALLKKEEDLFLIRADQGLLGLKRKVLLDYFSNCPDLRREINQKEINEVWQVVDFYNSNCAD